MRVLSLFILAVIASFGQALAPPSSSAARRAFLVQATQATAFTAAVSVATPSFAKEEYTLDTGDVVVPEQSNSTKKNSGSSLVAGALAGSVLLSLPFFLPNLLRLAGINNAKNPTKK
eukprot:CAMPEP_0176499382 /NCGR_PEP_ID=MMETSP0200_2-20121128/12895_1 /TAXON_ID=947934 /ORGANISM="Chaetoceros sp., Strain GSL56" /LENGTH=116 /DNA_ID=CAMNT_0017897793 /DNA_START=130 /DNA_END=480 /DNA_ORIENTATION=-